MMHFMFIFCFVSNVIFGMNSTISLVSVNQTSSAKIQDIILPFALGHFKNMQACEPQRLPKSHLNRKERRAQRDLSQRREDIAVRNAHIKIEQHMLNVNYEDVGYFSNLRESLKNYFYGKKDINDTLKALKQINHHIRHVPSTRALGKLYHQNVLFKKTIDNAVSYACFNDKAGEIVTGFNIDGFRDREEHIYLDLSERFKAFMQDRIDEEWAKKVKSRAEDKYFIAFMIHSLSLQNTTFKISKGEEYLSANDGVNTYFWSLETGKRVDKPSVLDWQDLCAGIFSYNCPKSTYSVSLASNGLAHLLYKHLSSTDTFYLTIPPTKETLLWEEAFANSANNVCALLDLKESKVLNSRIHPLVRSFLLRLIDRQVYTLRKIHHDDNDL